MGFAVRNFQRSEDAISAMQEPGSRYLGGGTLILRQSNIGDTSIKSLVRLAAGKEKRIIHKSGRVEIGSGVSMSQIIADPVLAWLAPAARCIGGPAVRNVATIGGNLYALPPYGDFGVALTALDASVTLATAAGSTTLATEEFFRQRDTSLRGAIIRFVSFEVPPESAFRFVKVSRVKPKGLSVVTLSAVLREEQGQIALARIAYGAMAEVPVRAKRVEAALVGQPLTEDLIGAVLPLALEGTRPTSDPLASGWYRRRVLPVHLRRLLLQDGRPQ